MNNLPFLNATGANEFRSLRHLFSITYEIILGMNLRLGEFYWQDPGVMRAIRNTGTTRVEFVEFELK